jgi:hypothetical protein
MLEKKNIAVTGSAEEISDTIASMVENVGFTDLNLLGYFETAGLTGEEADDQLRAFSEQVVPYLKGEYPTP